MIPELGQFALILALLVAIAQSALPLIGAHTGNSRLMATARPAAIGQFLLVLVSFVLLTISFINNDFSVEYVAKNSNLELPFHYRISAVWAAHEGSLLLWALILSGWTVAVALRSKVLPQALLARVMAVMGLISLGFLLFIVLTSNPFLRLSPAPFDGNNLNPLLQDFGLIIHPPLLYMGYVGLAVPFAFAVAALIGGQLDAAWTRWMRPWATMAWVFLTLGIMLGSWWAYYELGWGGWWFWDPVENASFMPWLVGTALIHSLAVTEKRGLFKSWTVLLAISAFSLSLLGTFLVRSGVLVSVHAFATDPERGVFILIFLALVIIGSLALFAFRASALSTDATFKLWSREGFLLLNNLLFTASAFFVLLGTLAPLFVDVLGGGKISVGPPYFNKIFVPPMLMVAALVGIGPLLRWRDGGDISELKSRLPIAVACLGLALLMPWAANKGFKPGVALALWLAFWAASAVILPLFTRIKRGTLSNMSLSQWGMTVAHFGITVFIIGAAFLSSYSIEKDVRVKPGETLEFEGYRFEFQQVLTLPGPNYLSKSGYIRVFEGDRLVAELNPEKRSYRSSSASSGPMTEAGIAPGFTRDLYVSLADQFDDGSWAVRYYVKPFVRWIWAGAILMALGGLLAACDRRYRVPVRSREAGDKKGQNKVGQTVSNQAVNNSGRAVPAATGAV